MFASIAGAAHRSETLGPVAVGLLSFLVAVVEKGAALPPDAVRRAVAALSAVDDAKTWTRKAGGREIAVPRLAAACQSLAQSGAHRGQIDGLGGLSGRCRQD